MIYPACIGVVIVACGILHAWFSWTTVISIGIVATVGIFVLWAIREGKLSKPSATVQASTMPSTAAASTPSSTIAPSAPTPSPAPPAATAAPQKLSWVWTAIAGALAGTIIFWYFIAPVLRTTVSPAPPAAKKELRQYVIKRDLKFVGGNEALEKDDGISIRNGHAAFITRDLPWRQDAVYHIVFCVTRESTGDLCIEINRRSGIIYYKHFASKKPETAVFFESGMKADPNIFNPGINQIEFWSPGDEVVIQYARIEMAYWE